MRKIKMGLIALAALTGVGGAFALNSPKKVLGATYYGYKIDANTQGWALSPPAFTGCNPDPKAFACTITSTAAQATVLATENQYPPNTGTKSHVGSMWE